MDKFLKRFAIENSKPPGGEDRVPDWLFNRSGGGVREREREREREMKIWFPIKLLLLVFATAVGAWGIQIFPFVLSNSMHIYASLYALFFIDFLASFIIVLVFRKILVAIFFIQLISYISIGSYIVIFNSIPSLTVFINGSPLLKGIGLISLFSYVDPIVVSFSLSIFCVQLFFLRVLYAHNKILKNNVIIVLTLLFLCMHWIVSIQSPIHSLTTNHAGTEAEKGNYKDFMVESMVRRGYFATALAELASGRAFEKNNIEQTCSSQKAARLPLLPVTDRVVMIQVESLGRELLDAYSGGEFVMPFLRTLQDTAYFFLMDGTKKLASANTDYEILNTRVARQDILHYHITAFFPDSIIHKFAARGMRPSVWHGVTGTYMGLRSAYTSMGFTSFNFKEELEQQELNPRQIGFEGVVTDADLLDHAARLLPADNPFFWFIITMTMHIPGYQPSLPVFQGDAFADFYSECRRTDDALRNFVSALPEGTTLIIYGDHKSYFGNPSPNVPVLIAVTGKDISGYNASHQLERCEMSHYLRRLFGMPAPSLQELLPDAIDTNERCN